MSGGASVAEVGVVVSADERARTAVRKRRCVALWQRRQSQGVQLRFVELLEDFEFEFVVVVVHVFVVFDVFNFSSCICITIVAFFYLRCANQRRR